MKSGLDHPALTQMVRTLTGEQAISQQDPRSLQGPSFSKFLSTHDEKIADQIGMIEKITVLIAGTKVCDVAELRKLLKKARPISPELPEVNSNQPARQARGLGIRFYAER